MLIKAKFSQIDNNLEVSKNINTQYIYYTKGKVPPQAFRNSPHGPSLT